MIKVCFCFFSILTLIYGHVNVPLAGKELTDEIHIFTSENFPIYGVSS